MEIAGTIGLAAAKADSARTELQVAVRAFLSERQESQAELARILGFSRSYMNDIMQGRRLISADFLERLGRLPA
jgi:transcriptional regulator with XRE-family HTH domain